MENLKPPYEYRREEFYKLLEEYRSSGPCSSQKYNGKTDWKLVSHLKRIEFMSFGVHQWLYEKALRGCSESLWKLDYGYDLYQEVQNKYSEMTKKPNHGGKRSGAGRKPGKKAFKNVAKKEATVVMRVPKGLVEHFKELIALYTQQSKK